MTNYTFKAYLINDISEPHQDISPVHILPRILLHYVPNIILSDCEHSEIDF